MSFSVLLCFLVTALIPFCSTHSSKEVRYECGPHGKFEYCIDGIPGCVIGCHCHPGYYFDTDTKICEPNVKLAQDFRRHYLPEPTRVYDSSANIATATDAIPTPTGTDNVDNKVDEMPKDTDELGDWLYNQFFKTIESQVINNSNNTKPNSKEKQPTRRSGGDRGPPINKSKRKTRKSMRGGKKKHMKVHGLRRKLLRITEDDSLFDSESDSDSSDSSSGSDSDGSSDGGSGDTSEGKKSENDKDDKDHGHKKVIIFNKRPKPPLPSFIFLPSMDTPYYPPIGLPPPPAMPMYPMIPVPPMAPPMFPPPFPGSAKCDDEGHNATTTSAAPPTSSQSNDVPTTEHAASESDAPTTEETPAESPPPAPADRRSRLEKHRRRPIPEQFIARANEPGKQGNLKHGPRNKLMQKLREKMKAKRRNRISPIVADLDEFPGEQSALEEDVPTVSLESYTPSKSLPLNNPELQQIPKLEDVDFKYLSELIHRVNQSDTKGRLSSLPFDLTNDLKELQKIKAQQTRRNYDSYNSQHVNVQPETNQHRNLQKPNTDDTYYTNLGRQIASMIRNADSKVEPQFHKDAEQPNRQVQFHSVLNENSYVPRSFWERSVRSPIPQIGPFNNYLDESRTLRHSNEKSLFNLENEVETFATTPSPLSLQDLENILNTMQKVHAHIHFRQPLTSTKQSNVSLNVNLLPKYVRTENTFRRLFNAPDIVEPITEHYQTPLPKKIYVETFPANITNSTVFHEPDTNYNVPFSDYWIYNNNQNPIQPKPKPVIVAQTNKPPIRDKPVYYSNPVRQTPVTVVLRPNVVSHKPRGEYLQFLKSMPLIKQTTPKRLEPKLVNYNTLNYFSGNKHHYMFETASYPLLSPFKRQITKRVEKPSYFHHHLHHFEYFD